MQDWSPTTAHAYRKLLGGDAVSAYASDARGLAAPFAELARHTQAWWDQSAATGSAVVPLATTGWDPRPRIASASAQPSPSITCRRKSRRTMTWMSCPQLVS